MKNLAISIGMSVSVFLCFGFWLSWLMFGGVILLFVILPLIPSQLIRPKSSQAWEAAGLFYLGLMFSLFACMIFLQGYVECSGYRGVMCATWTLSTWVFGPEQRLVPTVIGILALSSTLAFIGLQRLQRGRMG